MPLTKVAGSVAPTVNVAGGGSQVTSGTNLTLTSASNRVQSINMTAAGLTVTLPDATTLQTGGPTYILSADAAGNSYVIRDSAGNAITSVSSGQAVICNLVGNGTAAGVWSVRAFSSIAQLINGTAAIGNAVTSTYIGVARLTSTTALLAWYDATTTNNLFTAVVTVNGGSVTFGTLSNSNITPAAGNFLSIAALSATQVIMTYRAASTFLNAVIVNVSGTTVSSYGGVLVVNGVASTDTSVTALSSTQAICAYVDGTSGRAVTLNVSGSTITNGTIFSIPNSATGTYFAIATLSSTKAICTWSLTGASVQRNVVLDVSGTTVTSGATLDSAGGVNSWSAIAVLSSTRAITTFRGTSNFLYAVILDVSGSTITGGNVLTVNGVASQNTALATVNSTTAICTYYTSGGVILQTILSVSGINITNSTPATLTTGSTGAPWNVLASLSSNRFVGAYQGGGFISAQPIEYTVSV